MPNVSNQSGLQQAFKICFVSLIVAETHGRSDEVGGWHSDFEGNDSGGSEIGSDSDWTPDGQPNQKDRSEIKEESESPPLPSKPSKKRNRKIRVLNTECKFVGGSGTGVGTSTGTGIVPCWDKAVCCRIIWFPSCMSCCLLPLCI